jgi:hypothetical protein
MVHRAFIKGDGGFVIPVALGIGLILLLAGTITIIRTQTDKQSSFARKVSVRSLNAAETGISRIRALVGRYPDVANRNLDDWVNALSCLNRTPLINAANKNWQDIEPGQPNRGQYRIVDYQYNNGQGVLGVEGRINRDELAESVTRVEVTIPVRPPLPSEAMPGLWLFTNNPRGMDSEQIQGDIALNTCAIPGQGPDNGNLANPTPPQYRVILSQRVPTLPTLPSGVTPLSPSPFILGNTGTPAADGRYKYSVSELKYNHDLDPPLEIAVEPTKKVDLFVNGDIELTGDGEININKAGQANQLRIFGMNTNTVLLGSSGTIRAFIFAPNAVATIEDGGKQSKTSKKPKKNKGTPSPSPTPAPAPGGNPNDKNFNFNGIVGSLWVRDWNKTPPYAPDARIKVFAEGSFADYDWPQNELGQNKISTVSLWNRATVK